MKTKIPEVGTRVGHLTVVDNNVRVEGHSGHECLCKCDCGRYSIVQYCRINTNNAKSCGCTYGIVGLNDLATKQRLRAIWKNMIDRCVNPRCSGYKCYGERGITVCDDWTNSFRDFAEWALSHGYRNDLTIDRINVNGNYEPANCRWATMTEQQNNRRSNRLYTMDGKTQSITMWAREYGINAPAFRDRLYNGWDLKRALTEPIHEKEHPKSGSHKGVRNYKLVTFNGKTQTISAWARELNINKESLLYRFKSGWSVEDALTIPVKKRGEMA